MGGQQLINSTLVLHSAVKLNPKTQSVV